MKICLLRKGPFEELPQIMSVALVLRELGHEVNVIAGYAEARTRERFAEQQIEITAVGPRSNGVRGNGVQRYMAWIEFARAAWRCIERSGQYGLLWISTADTALALGSRLLSHRFVLQVRELYDTQRLYRWALTKYLKGARCVVVPEMCRAAIIRSWYGLSRTPVVLPNKSIYHPRRRRLSIEDNQANSVIASLARNCKILLYQGHIGPRRDVRGVAQVIEELGGTWRFILMGPADGGYLHSLTAVCPTLVYIPRVTAPYHLEITSHAYVGVVAYSWGSLNNVFCAPNKVWEYSGFGIPMICSALPSLQALFAGNSAGVCVDLDDGVQVERALRKIDSDYRQCSEAAQRLYESVDVQGCISEIIDEATRS